MREKVSDGTTGPVSSQQANEEVRRAEPTRHWRVASWGNSL